MARPTLANSRAHSWCGGRWTSRRVRSFDARERDSLAALLAAILEQIRLRQLR
jgi:hypothetical protein